MIKEFEGFKNYKAEQKYKVGDYILLADDLWAVEHECKIVEVSEDKLYDKLADNYDIYPRYKIKTYIIKNNEEYEFWVENNEIERKMTPEEIEDYKISKIAKKYNL